MQAKILIVATLDTKGQEAAFLKELIESKGHIPVILDCGVLGKPSITPDISRETVAMEAGTTLKEILDKGDTILFKSSRALKLETLIEQLQEEDCFIYSPL